MYFIPLSFSENGELTFASRLATVLMTKGMFGRASLRTSKLSICALHELIWLNVMGTLTGP